MNYYVVLNINQWANVFLLLFTNTGLAQAALTVTTGDQMSVREGDTINLVCTYSPRTEDPLYFGSLSWQMGTTVLASLSCPSQCTETNLNRDRFALNVDKLFSGNLTISGVTIADDNIYECIANTFEGTGQDDIQVVVNGKYCGSWSYFLSLPVHSVASFNSTCKVHSHFCHCKNCG